MAPAVVGTRPLVVGKSVLLSSVQRQIRTRNNDTQEIRNMLRKRITYALAAATVVVGIAAGVATVHADVTAAVRQKEQQIIKDAAAD